jgi:hypothetical protein
MTRAFCTLLDSAYLARGIVLHNSLLRHAGDFELTVFCFDDQATETLRRLGLPRMSVVGLDQLKRYQPGLQAVEHVRTRAEFCWTATPALPLYMLDAKPELSDVTYLDADVSFFADPQPVFDEMGDASILITPHRYAPPYRHHQVSGIYNVQFLAFRNDARARRCLEWWSTRCLEWCFDRLEDGKYGDQKYLDDWPERFAGVHTLAHKGAGLAPWNLSAYQLRGTADGVLVDDDPLIFFHYHGLRTRPRDRHRLAPPGYLLSQRARDLIYEPYLGALSDAAKLAREISPGLPPFDDPPPRPAQLLRDARISLVEHIVQRVAPLVSLRARLASTTSRPHPPLVRRLGGRLRRARPPGQ